MENKIKYIDKFLKTYDHRIIKRQHNPGNNFKKNIEKKQTNDVIKFIHKKNIKPKKVSQIPPYYIIFKIAPGMTKIQVTYEVNTFRTNFVNSIA